MLVFNQALAAGNPSNLTNMQRQYAAVNAHRNDARHALNPAFLANAGVNPTDLYRDFDTVTVRQFHLDEGDAILSRLLPLGRSLPVGRMISSYARASGMGGFQTSMSGDVEVSRDKVDYDFGDTLIPVHQNGFGTNWREADQLSLESFDDAAVKQSEAARTHRKGIVSYLLDGTDASYKGTTWNGFRADTRVDQVDLSAGDFAFDFTDSANTGKQFVDAFTALAERRYVTQKVMAPATYFVSNEIFWRMAADYSTEKGDNKILDRVRQIPGVGEVVPSSALSGNEILSMVLTTEYIQPLVGMGVSTIALPRPQYNSAVEFDVVSVMGIECKLDFENGGTAIQHAQG